MSVKTAIAQVCANQIVLAAVDNKIHNAIANNFTDSFQDGYFHALGDVTGLSYNKHQHSSEVIDRACDIVNEFVSLLADTACAKESVVRVLARNGKDASHFAYNLGEALCLHTFGKRNELSRYPSILKIVDQNLTKLRIDTKEDQGMLVLADAKWLKDVASKMKKTGTKGALHRYFKIPEDQVIPLKTLKEALKDPKISDTTRKRIQFAINMHGINKPKAKPATATAATKVVNRINPKMQELFEMFGKAFGGKWRARITGKADGSFILERADSSGNVRHGWSPDRVNFGEYGPFTYAKALAFIRTELKVKNEVEEDRKNPLPIDQAKDDSAWIKVDPNDEVLVLLGWKQEAKKNKLDVPANTVAYVIRDILSAPRSMRKEVRDVILSLKNRDSGLRHLGIVLCRVAAGGKLADRPQLTARVQGLVAQNVTAASEIKVTVRITGQSPQARAITLRNASDTYDANSSWGVMFATAANEPEDSVFSLSSSANDGKELILDILTKFFLRFTRNTERVKKLVDGGLRTGKITVDMGDVQARAAVTAATLNETALNPQRGTPSVPAKDTSALFPIGAFVMLKDGRTGKVVKHNPNDYNAPTVINCPDRLQPNWRCVAIDGAGRRYIQIRNIQGE